MYGILQTLDKIYMDEEKATKLADGLTGQLFKMSSWCIQFHQKISFQKLPKL